MLAKSLCKLGHTDSHYPGQDHMQLRTHRVESYVNQFWSKYTVNCIHGCCSASGSMLQAITLGGQSILHVDRRLVMSQLSPEQEQKSDSKGRQGQFGVHIMFKSTGQHSNPGESTGQHTISPGETEP